MWWKATEGSKRLEAVYYSGDRLYNSNEKSSIDCDEGNEREHRELSHITHQHNSAENNIKQFRSALTVCSRLFEVTITEQLQTYHRLTDFT